MSSMRPWFTALCALVFVEKGHSRTSSADISGETIRIVSRQI